LLLDAFERAECADSRSLAMLSELVVSVATVFIDHGVLHVGSEWVATCDAVIPPQA
jgi:hypothetical protein